MKGIQTGREEVKLFQFGDNVHLKDPKNFIRKLLDLIIIFSKVEKTTYENQQRFIY